jgi:Tol biopolymer transport system component
MLRYLNFTSLVLTYLKRQVLNIAFALTSLLLVDVHLSFAQSSFGSPQSISVSNNGTAGNGTSNHCRLGRDGRFVVYDSVATNLVSPPTTNGISQVFLRNTIAQTTELVSALNSSATTGGNADSEYPSIGANTNLIVFHSAANNLVANDTNNKKDIFIRDRTAPGSTTRISIGHAHTGFAQSNGDSFYPDISDDGRYIVFLSEASNLVTTDNDSLSDIFVKDIQNNSIERISVAHNGQSPNGPSFAGSPSISADGRYVVFGSFASNLVATDTNNKSDIFLRDRNTNSTEIVGIAPDGVTFGAGEAVSTLGPGSISDDGRFISFGLDSDGDAFVDKLFIRDRQTQTTRAISVNAQGQNANDYTDYLRISASGTLAIFYSPATNLLAGAPNGGTILFNLSSNQRQLIAGVNSGEPCFSSDGATVGYFEPAGSPPIQQIFTRSNDQCPNDPNKTAPGLCGCGQSDVDSDSDGTLDCLDECPSNPAKTKPGLCGCNSVDTDSDGDKTPNCLDLCPQDPQKIAPGKCGCGVVETATCLDQCPNDPLKQSPGICGCDIPDIDTDNDGTQNCTDGCIDDAQKIVPGICGCGINDLDGDLDGTSDCLDECIDDPNKTTAGICGCGIPNTDSDGDQTPDCIDLCPNDNNKISANLCGCGSTESDKNNNVILDCFEKKGRSALPLPLINVDFAGNVHVTLPNLKNIKFELQVRKGAEKVQDIITKRYNPKIRKLPNGTYKLSYAFINTRKKPAVRSKFSGRVTFKVKREK